MWPVIFFALLKLFLNFRIKHSRPEPSILPMSGTQLYFLLLPLVGVPNGHDSRTWAPFFNSDIFSALFKSNLKTGHFIRPITVSPRKRAKVTNNFYFNAIDKT